MTNFADLCKEIGLPDEIYASYARRNVKQLYDWQLECLTSTDVQNGGNLIYSAPTGGGKTLVAEIAILRAVLVRGQKAMLVLPYVSLVLEQIKSLRRIVLGYNRRVTESQRIRIDGYYGDGKSSKKRTAHIMVCTIEKSNAVLNSLLAANRLSQLGVVVIDEMHVLGDKQRGYHLEILISKLLFACSKHRSDKTCQLVALSATMSNLPDIAAWFRSDLYATKYRPVPLKEYVCAGGELWDTTGQKIRFFDAGKPISDNEVVLQLCREGLSNAQQIIVFCSSRYACQATATMLAEKFGGQCNHRDEVGGDQQRRDASQRITEDATTLRALVTQGVAYHHAGLADTDRTNVENMFRSGVISILTATSTLAAGVNLPAGRVIIHSLRIGREKLGSIQYKQMSGRAGRAGLTNYGESIIVVRPSERHEALTLCTAPLPAIHSQMQPSLDGGKALMRAMIELFTLQLCSNTDDIDRYMQFTLLFRESSNDQASILAAAKQNLHFLLVSKVVIRDTLSTAENLKITRFGRAVYESNMNTDDAILLYDDLLAAQESLNLETNHQLIYLVTPLEHSLSIDFRRVWNLFDKSKSKSCKDMVAQLVGYVLSSSKLNEGLLFKWSHQPPSASLISTCTDMMRKDVLCGRHDESSEIYVLLKVRRLWASIALTMLLDTQSTARVAQAFGSAETDIRQLYDSCVFLAHKLFRFCREIGWLPLEKLIGYITKAMTDALDQRCEYSHLLAIPGTTPHLARTLFDAGLHTIYSIANCDVNVLAQYLQLGMQFNVKEVDEIEVSLLTADTTANDNNMPSQPTANTSLMLRLTQMSTALKAAAQKHISACETSNEHQVVAAIPTADDSMSDEPYLPDGSSDEESSFDEDEDMQGYMYAIQNDENEEMNRDMYQRNDISTPLSACRTNATREITSVLSNSLGKTPEPYLASAMDDLNDEDLIALLLDAERNIEEREKANTQNSDAADERKDEDNFEPYIDEQSITAAVSPYALPYTPSKLATPGRYLYLPTHRVGAQGSATRARDAATCMSNKFGWVHLRRCSAIDFDAFLERLSKCTCFSFELVFRNIPVASVFQTSRNFPNNVQAAWRQFISSFAPRPTTKNVQLLPQVLAGIAICPGDDTGYYLPLPVPLPLLNRETVESPPNELIKGKGKVRVSLQTFPLRVKQLICRLVGFEGIVSYRSCDTKKSNPLLTASREWTALCRRELRLSWLKGHAVEWQVVGQVMRSPTVTKIAMDMKRVALALRERDVLVDGPLEDPLIARRLLGETAAMLDLRIPVVTATRDARHACLMQQCFRTIALIRCMAAMEQSLTAVKLFDLFNNIEMPLILSLAHAEFNGVCLNSSLLSDLRDCLNEREKTIECVFREVMGASFNPLSLTDVTKLKNKCYAETLAAVDENEFCETQRSETDNDISAQPQEHPLLHMLSEYRSITRMAPLCGSIYASRLWYDGIDGVEVRVRGVFDGLGTDTGRVIITSPPLQQMPHECKVALLQRTNLHEELLALGRDSFHLISSLHTKAKTGFGEEAKVVAMRRNNNANATTFGRIIEVMNMPISQCKVSMRNSQVQSFLLDEWRNAGHEYSNADAARIATVRVEINRNIYFYPADKVVRLLQGCYPLRNENADLPMRFFNPRDMFVSSQGTVLFAADYAQIELRLLAHLSQDAKLCAAFHSPGDIFRSIAAQWMNESDPGNISDKDRKRVKQLCYALLYGAGPKKVAADAGCTVHEAEMLIQGFLGCYSGIQAFIDAVKKRCRKEGQVRTLLGRRRVLPEITSSVMKDRSRAERQAVNTLCQGSAADLIKLAMVNIHYRLKEQFGGVHYHCRRSMPGGGLYTPFDGIRLVLQIHDELVFEVPQRHVAEVAGIVKHCMEHAVNLHVPLHVKLSVGETWGSLTEIDSIDTVKPIARKIFAE